MFIFPLIYFIYLFMKTFVSLVMLLAVSLVSAQDTYLQCGNILDVVSGKTLSEKTIVVSNGKIKSI